MKPIFVLLLVITFANVTPASAWDGYDGESDSDVEIEKGNLVRSGRDIEYYDYGTGKYHSGQVQDINRTYSGVEVEVYDYDTGETRICEMED